LRLFRAVLAFILTLLLFWISPQLQPNEENQFLDATVQDFLVDHGALTRFYGPGCPELTAHITTPIDTSRFSLQACYQTTDMVEIVRKRMTLAPATLDLYAVSLPCLQKGESYHYHLELHDSVGTLLARLPEIEAGQLTLLFLGQVPVWLLTAHLAFLFLGAMFAWLALFDAVWMRTAKIRLKKLYQKALTATFFLLVGGCITGAVVSHSIRGFFWSGWPFGNDLSQTLWALTVGYWIVLTLLLKGTIFGFKPKKNLVSAGGATVLTLLGVFLIVIVYVTRIEF